MKKQIAILLLISLPTAGYAQELPKSYYTSEALVITSHALDLATTQRCLGAGICHETNPFLARYNDPIAFTTAKFGLGFAQLYLNRKLARVHHEKLATTINLMVSGILTGVAIHNQRLVKHRAKP